MRQLHSYQVIETIHEGESTTIYRGTDEQQQPVIIKTLKAEYPDLKDIARLKHEYDILQDLQINGVVQALDLVKQDTQASLIFEDFGGESLKKIILEQGCFKTNLASFLHIAIALTDILGEIHNAHIIHKDIKPANIIINQTTGEVKITDFGISSRLTTESQSLDTTLLEGTLSNISPEQTGRMNRAIDYRTDYYSLGITFYEMLTGQLPFSSTDPLELIHCHIAKVPPSPRQLDPTIPEVISDIIMKLLLKTAEERYQTTFGLRADLETCLEQLTLKGQISHFEVGHHDISGKFQIPQKLYGREEDVATLMAAFERVSQGYTEMMLVGGYSGIGKSSLVHEIHKPIAKGGGYFISGKFDQFQRNIPYASFIQAFRDLVLQLLTESSTAIQQWQDLLLAALGPNGQVIIDVIPEVELIIGTQPPVPHLGPAESQNRFNFVFQQFVTVFTQKEHPLVLFLDDLQWADSASLRFIQLLMTTANSPYLLFIGAYRDNEVDPSHPLLLTIDEIKRFETVINTINVKPLALAHVNQLIAETLSCSAEQSQSLANLCLQKTQGNPFFLNQLLRELHNDQLITFDSHLGFWQWNIDQIQAQEITDNVVELMVGKIQKMAPLSQERLKLAACMGNRFNLNVLAVVSETSLSECASNLWQPLHENLLLPLDDSYKIPLALRHETWDHPEHLVIDYKFLHDRVQQAAYALIPEADKQATHLKIGQLLLNNTSDSELDDKIFEIVNHLNLAADLIQSNDLRYQLAQLNLSAGQKAKDATAYEPALRYFNQGIKAIPGDPWTDYYELAFALYREQSECEYLCSHFEAAEHLFDTVLSHARTDLEKAEIQIIRLALYDIAAKYIESLQIGSEALKMLGITIPIESDAVLVALETELEHYRTYLKTVSIADLIAAPLMTQPELQASMQLLMNMTGPAYFTNQDLLALTTIKMVNLSIQHGNSDVSAHGYAFWGVVSGARLQEFDLGYEFGQLAMQLLDKMDNPNVRCKVYNSFGALISPWKSSLDHSIPILRQGYQDGVEIGDVYASYNSYNLIMQRLIAAHDLDSVMAESQKHEEFLKRAKNSVFVGIQQLDQHFILNIQGKTQNRYSLSDDQFNEQDCVQMLKDNLFFPGIATYNIFKTHILYLYGDYINALKQAQCSQESVVFVSGIINFTEHYYYYSLVLTALYPSASHQDQTQYWTLLEQHQTQMKLWADHCPINFQHKYLLVAAEMARITQQFEDAVHLYDQAIEAAKVGDFFQNVALANELAAKFWLEHHHERIARVYLREAYYYYQLWGAVHKVNDIKTQYPEVAVSPQQSAFQTSTTTRSSTTGQVYEIDLTTVIRASQALAGEIIIERLLEQLMKTVIENAGAQQGFILLHRNDQWVIEAEKSVNQEVSLLQSSSVATETRVPMTIINYVTRLKESVILNDASHEGSFTQDPYILQHQPKSILCIPLLKQGELIGILYLENNLTTNAFTPSRVEFLGIISAQAAISIENSHLYEQLEDYNRTLERKVEERTQELQDKNGQLGDALKQLKATQDQIIAQQKLASLGALTAGIAHEIKNPLNFVNNFAELSVELVEELSQELEAQSEHLSTETLEYFQEILSDLNQNVHKINEHGRRADGIVRSMLMHSRGDGGEWQLTDINTILKEAVNLAYHGMRARDSAFNISIGSEYAAEIQPIITVQSNINRVFLNIINNACYATREKQKQAEPHYSPELQVKTQVKGQHIEIRIRDNGIGIPQNVVDKIFNPFFTTKPTGQGTGLGLSICHDIVVQEHKGEIQVETEAGQYTEFIVLLPNVNSLG